MFATVVAIEVKVRGAVKTSQSLHLILYSMRMHNIHDYCNTLLMSGINKCLKFLGSSKA
ncbi:hypothetical protein IMSAG192_00767 [Muribaculaceae bacterium]|nr:hypothetical protein IMSAG192_00767 [Muribaculaceae bacterium]